MARVSVCASFHLHVIHDERLIVRSLSVSSCLSFSCFSPSFTSSLPHSTCSLTCTPSSMWTAPRETPAAPSPNEEYCSLAIYHPSTNIWPEVWSQMSEKNSTERKKTTAARQLRGQHNIDLEDKELDANTKKTHKENFNRMFCQSCSAKPGHLQTAEL